MIRPQSMSSGYLCTPLNSDTIVYAACSYPAIVAGHQTIIIAKLAAAAAYHREESSAVNLAVSY